MKLKHDIVWVDKPQHMDTTCFLFDPKYLQCLADIHCDEDLGYLESRSNKHYFCLSLRKCRDGILRHIFPTSHCIIEVDAADCLNSKWLGAILNDIYSWLHTYDLSLDCRLGQYLSPEIVCAMVQGVKDIRVFCFNKWEDAVFVDLTLSTAQLWNGFRHSAKTNLKKARKKKLICELEVANKNNLSIFWQIYQRTMKRLKAKGFYFFHYRFFEALAGTFRDRLLSATVTNAEGVPCASGLWVTSGGDVDAFLAASDERFWHLRPNNCLFGESIFLLKRKGYSRFLLGGGHEKLMQFKKSFSKSINPCYTIKLC